MKNDEITDELHKYFSKRQKKVAKTLRKRYGRNYFRDLANKRHNKAE